MRAAPGMSRAIALRSQRIDMAPALETALPGSRRMVKAALTLGPQAMF